MEGHCHGSLFSGKARSGRRGLLTTMLLVLLAAGALGLCITSYFVEWSRFTATPPRPVPGGTQARDEVHYMFGHGRAMIVSMSTYTLSFNQPTADLNSQNLAWAVLPNFFPSSLWGRIESTSLGPLVCVPLWIPAATMTSVAVIRIVFVRRRVRPGHCRRCRYDLTGTVPLDDGAVQCPECGLTQALGRGTTPQPYPGAPS